LLGATRKIRYPKSMKKVAFSALFLLIFSFPAGATPALVPVPLNAGEPGCLDSIQGKVISDENAKTLPPECQTFRNAYLYGLRTYSENPQKLSEEIKTAIQDSVTKKSARPPYDALLLALYTKDASVKKAIEARAAYERKAKIFYAYADALLERINTGKCTHFKMPGYAEICQSRDLLFEHLIALQAVRAKGSS
jgi:hypothetical protein